MANKIVCIIVNYNGINDTVEAIRSLENSSCPIDIIVIDNASKNEEGTKLKNMFSDINVIINTTNVGFAGANNIGMKYALDNGYSYILLLNNDTVIAKDMIEELMDYADEKTVVVPTMYYYSDPQTIWYAGGKFNRFTGSSKHIISKNISGNINFATGCCMLIPSQIVKEIGMLDESYFMYCEDADYSIKLIKSKKNIVNVPTAHLWHKVGKSSATVSNLSLYYYNRNRLFLTSNNRNFFFFTAFPISLLTRYIRLLQAYFRKDEKWKVYKKAIHDYFHKINGKVDNFT